MPTPDLEGIGSGSSSSPVMPRSTREVPLQDFGPENVGVKNFWGHGFSTPSEAPIKIMLCAEHTILGQATVICLDVIHAIKGKASQPQLAPQDFMILRRLT